MAPINERSSTCRTIKSATSARLITPNCQSWAVVRMRYRPSHLLYLEAPVAWLTRAGASLCNLPCDNWGDAMIFRLAISNVDRFQTVEHWSIGEEVCTILDNTQKPRELG